jgi:CheY-like chemotaxis protein
LQVSESQQVKDVILVVDDEKEICELLVEQLATKGHTVIAASNGFQAMSIIEKRSADYGSPCLTLIICDWVMPEMDGIAFLQNLRASPYRSTPFLLMSGAVTREQLVSATRYDLDGILIKPFSLTALLQKVEQALKTRESKDLAGLLHKAAP